MRRLPVVCTHLDVQLLHQQAHDIITLAVDLQRSEIVFGRPLKHKHGGGVSCCRDLPNTCPERTWRLTM